MSPFFYPLIYQKLFFLLSWVIHVKLNLNILGFLGIKRLLTGQIASCSLSSIWSSFTEHPVDIDQLKLIMLLVGTPGPELLKKLSSESVSSKGLHKRCAITHICADALTACFPPWALCAFCLFYWVIMLCLQRRSDAGGLIRSSFSLFKCSAWRFVASFLQICRIGCLKMYTLLQGLQPASCLNTAASAAPRSTEKQLLNQLCSIA